jgi:hypothetical protein
MADWLRVEFYAKLPDGMNVSDVDESESCETLARAFGFAQVSGLSISQTTDGPVSTRKLVDERPRQPFGGPDWSGHPSRHHG